MLTKITLDGPMGKAFGRNWNLQANSPSEALRMIDANKPGVFGWIKLNLQKYSHYRVICEYEDGRVESLVEEEEYKMERKCKSIRFVPVVSGSSGVVKAVLGIILIVVGVVFSAFLGPAVSGFLIKAGIGLLISGVAQMLAPKPQSQEQSERKDKTSYFFDGPANTTQQGVPVQLIYGTCLVGSHAISAEITIDQLMETDPAILLELKLAREAAAAKAAAEAAAEEEALMIAMGGGGP